MADPYAHYRVAYHHKGGKINSMSHVTRDKALSMVTMLNQYTSLGRFVAEDEHEDGQYVATSAAA